MCASAGVPGLEQPKPYVDAKVEAEPYDAQPEAEPYVHEEIPAEPYVDEKADAAPYVHVQVDAEPYFHEEIPGEPYWGSRHPHCLRCCSCGLRYSAPGAYTVNLWS